MAIHSHTGDETRGYLGMALALSPLLLFRRLTSDNLWSASTLEHSQLLDHVVVPERGLEQNLKAHPLVRILSFLVVLVNSCFMMPAIKYGLSSALKLLSLLWSINHFDSSWASEPIVNASRLHECARPSYIEIFLVLLVQFVSLFVEMVMPCVA